MDCAGWVENVVDSTRFDRIDTNRSPIVESTSRKSICANRDSIRIESNREVPQTNRLGLGVLDMDV